MTQLPISPVVTGICEGCGERVGWTRYLPLGRVVICGLACMKRCIDRMPDTEKMGIRRWHAATWAAYEAQP